LNVWRFDEARRIAAYNGVFDPTGYAGQSASSVCRTFIMAKQ
jgi:hypothetical protein